MRCSLSLWLLFACLASAADPYTSQAGPFRLETMREVWHDAKRKRDIPVKVYFPKQATNPCPVIIFSHGLGGSRDAYSYVGEHWASHGYVSVHLQHRGSDDSVWRGKGGMMESMRNAVRDPQVALDRPLDVTFAIDQLQLINQSQGPLRGRLDLDRLGMAGHSFGAWTTLVIAGQRLGPTQRNLADKRIKAAIAMSAPVPKLAERNYADITLPILHLTGTKDDSPIGDNTPEDRRIPFDATKSAPAYLVTFEGGDHMVFSGRFPIGPRRFSGKDRAIHDLIKAGSTAFWDAWLRGDSKAKAWLDNGGFKDALGSKAKLEAKSH